MTLTNQLDLALAPVEGRAPAVPAHIWPRVAVPCAAAPSSSSSAADEALEEQAKLEAAAAVYARVLPMMGARAGRVTDMLLTALTAAELRQALHAQDGLHAHAQRMASLLP